MAARGASARTGRLGTASHTSQSLCAACRRVSWFRFLAPDDFRCYKMIHRWEIYGKDPLDVYYSGTLVDLLHVHATCDRVHEVHAHAHIHMHAHVHGAQSCMQHVHVHVDR